jgi:hypothetical protein
VTLWGEVRSGDLDVTTDSVQHRLSAAARVFKTQALRAAATNVSADSTETFRSKLIGSLSVADLTPASCDVS